MVDELIALSRLQGAEKLPDLEAVDVDTVVAEALSRYKVAAEDAGITVTTDAPSGLRSARRPDAAGHRAVQSGLERDRILAQRVSGVGQPVDARRQRRDRRHRPRRRHRRADQERVFERFFRVDKARSRATGGTGLGLAIVKHVAANHNGSIRLWSKPGTGSTFTLPIPAHVTTDDSTPTTRTTGSTNRQTRPRQ